MDPIPPYTGAESIEFSHPEKVFVTFCRYFAWDYRVLKTFARHYSTGEIIPEKLVESMRGAKNMFAATELQRQV